VLQKNFDRLDGHGAVTENRQARNLSRLHQVLQDENKLLRALNGKRRNDHAAAAIGRRRDQRRKFRHRVFFGMNAIPVSRLHYDEVCDLTLGRAGVHDFTRSDCVIADAANITGE
jgi:hypothetical protein